MLQAGNSYRAIISQAELAESKSGGEQIAIVANVYDENGVTNPMRFWSNLGTDESFKFSVNLLRSFGWQDDDGFDDLSRIIGVEGSVQLDMKNGYLDIKYLNGPHNKRPEVRLELLPEGKKQSMAAKMRQRLEAIKAKEGGRNSDDIPFDKF